MYKLLAIDMDGTLLNSNGEISKENKDAIKKAVEKGVKVVITSGRSLKGIDRFLEDMGLRAENEYIIANNGGTIYRADNFKCISYNGLKGSDLKDLYSLSLKIDMQIMAYTHKECISPEENELTEFERESVGVDVKIVNYSLIEDNQEITKVLFYHDEEIRDEMMKKIPKRYFDKYNIIKTHPKLLEIMDKDCNKGYGVSILADHLEVKKDEIICIGDQTNDIEMITNAGLGVAMGNAIDELKSVAKYITADNDNNGVAKVIEKFIL
ncbi:Cof-type HAD-IIB family hydrolase [Clostridium sp. MB40-C1]|uniref:Cof-type HAD-IIB family hydrolase n=1 Tax=Clostridium sp. MB40-C1 TaxID=3070996 RepID=UPI0027DEF542|nr:Cof-type HAD-IIB family hydrolase [Clostridium sp. MB40-C1]WMJ80711.1 Cof-type HAD-IIB family hydrolase [Clostridium sp. MB40-C1]